MYGTMTIAMILGTWDYNMWVVVKTKVPFWVLNIMRHLVLRGPIKRP